jgi:hypothetical protein
VQKTKNTEFSIDLTTVAPKLFNLLEKGGAITKESIDLACERGEDIQVRRALIMAVVSASQQCAACTCHPGHTDKIAHQAVIIL